MTVVLYVEAGSGYGGSTVSLARCLSILDRSRFDPIVLLTDAQATEELLKPHCVRVVRVAQPGNWLFRRLAHVPGLSYLAHGVEMVCGVLPQAIRLADVIKRHRVDIVHTNNHMGSGLAAIWAACLCHVPCVIHLRNVRRLTWTERWATRFANWFVVLSQASRDAYVAQGVPTERLSIVYDPVLDEAARNGRASTRHALGIPVEVPVVGILSRLAPRKGHDAFLRAAVEVRRRFPATRFLIVGRENGVGGQRTTQLQSLAAELGLGSSMIFVGWRDDMPAVIAALDVVVDASRLREGTRLTVLEAMAMGKPVVATNVGGEAEFFDAGRCGILVEPGRQDQLADAIVRLLEDPAVAVSLGESARARVLELCNPVRSVQQLERIYETVLQCQERW